MTTPKLRIAALLLTLIVSICLLTIWAFQAFADDAGPMTVNYPRMSLRDIAQSALKEGDTFSISISGMGIPLSDIHADLQGLGLPNGVPMSGSIDSYSTTELTLPSGLSDGLKQFTVEADFEGSPLFFTGSVIIDQTPPTGTLEATFTKSTDFSGAWTAHVSGTFSDIGTEANIVNERTYGIDAEGNHVSGGYTSSADSILDASSPFSADLPMLSPDINWEAIGYTITLADAAGNLTQVDSAPMPIIPPDAPLIDHAYGTSTIEAPNFGSPFVGNTPAGIGIPYSALNDLPTGNYYATVFFDGLHGCPTTNYSMNAFIPDQIWGVDMVGPQGPYSKSYSTASGGCMQEFHIDHRKVDGSWLWGALDPGSAPAAIGDTNGVPAFAICASADTCDAVTVHPQENTAPPDTATSTASSVLFLPGIKGSKLYEQNPLCPLPSSLCDIPLWLPLADIGTPELFLDAQGKSERSAYVKDGDLLDSAFGQNFYHSFMDMMDAAETSGTFGSGWQWKPIAYDWRLSLPDIVHNGVQDDNRINYGETTDTPYIKQQLRELASSSPTGKVTIIAHSNGGLVAKELLRQLGDSLTSQLIDSVIFIGVPQSGAPRALGALLYGDSEGLPGIKNLPDLIMSTAHAREFGLNSPMAYHLLPSAQYMEAKNLDYPLVKFEDTPLLAAARSAYGDTIDTAAELHQFVLDQEGGRSMPDTSDLETPNILNAALLSYAEQEHQSLDAWTPPSGVNIYEIGGTDIPTISGIDLYEKPHRSGSSTLAYRPLFTTDGDGTVPIISSLMLNAGGQIHSIFMSLADMAEDGKTYSHGNLLESSKLQDVIQRILHGETPAPSGENNSPGEYLYFFLHSPASLDITDAEGRHAVVNNDESVQEDIPGSDSGVFGETKYVIVPTSAQDVFTLTLHGGATGTVTLDVQSDGGTGTTTTIADLPITSATTATATVHGTGQELSALQVDEDGDGTTDFSVSPEIGGTVFAPEVSSVQTGTEPTPDQSTDSSTDTSNPHAQARILTPSTTSPAVSAAAPLSFVANMKMATFSSLAHDNATQASEHHSSVLGASTSTTLNAAQDASSSSAPPAPLSFWARLRAWLVRAIKLISLTIKHYAIH